MISRLEIDFTDASYEIKRQDKGYDNPFESGPLSVSTYVGDSGDLTLALSFKFEDGDVDNVSISVDGADDVEAIAEYLRLCVRQHREWAKRTAERLKDAR